MSVVFLIYLILVAVPHSTAMYIYIYLDISMYHDVPGYKRIEGRHDMCRQRQISMNVIRESHYG